MVNPNEINVLIIEDDHVLRESIIETLKCSGFHVVGIESAEELPEQAKLLQINIIILDLNLPGENGLSLAKRLRQVHPQIGIIMLTARVLSEQRSLGYSSGADIYLPKPSSTEELRQSILSLARRLNITEESQSTGTLRLQLKELVLTGDGQEVPVTHKEALLLASFARASQNILEVWQIAEILQFDLDTLQKSVVELNISRLRKKLVECGESAKSIRAIRGTGYQLCAEIRLVS